MKILPLLALLLTLTSAQDQAPLVRTSTRVVLLDVVVSDKFGKPVRTFTRDDFTILEDGIPQKVSSFEAPLSGQSSPVPSSPRTIILLDELNSAFADLSYARDRILMFLAQNHLDHMPTALMTLNLHGIAVIQDYTQDAQLLKDKLNAFRPALLNPADGEGQQTKVQEHAQRSIDSLLDIAHASLGASYNLNLVWVTNGFAGALKETNSADGRQNGLRRLANVLMSARIRLYSIDPGGAEPLQASVVATPGSSKAMSSSNRFTGSHNNDDLALQGTAYEANQLLTLLTGMTGGRAYYGRNDVEVALTQAVDDGAGNYTLSYSPANDDFHGEYRKIEIRTNVEGATARTRLGYYAVAEEPAATPELREAKWTAALASPLRYEAFAMACPVTYDAATGRAAATLTVKPTPVIMESQQHSQEIIRVAALSSAGAILTSWSWQVDWKKTWTNRVTTATFDKVLPKKTERVRFLVSDPRSEHMGTCDYRLK